MMDECVQKVHFIVCHHSVHSLYVTHFVFGRPFVKRFALPYAIGPLSVLSVCLSCLSVTFVHCGQMVGQIKMKLGMQVGLGHGHTVLGLSLIHI